MDKDSTILITGGTGLIGTALTKAVTEKGYSVIILTRDVHRGDLVKENSKISYAAWDVKNGTIDRAAVEKADHIIHLAGANVGEKRWTKKRKEEIVESRVKSGSLLVKALTEIPNKVRSVICSSAIGWYGPDPVSDPGFTGFTETDPPANNFLGTTCVLWEKAVEPVTQCGKRLVHFRTGIVLSNESGVYKEFRRPAAYGVAAILGTGKQMVSWIHIDDLVRMYTRAIEDESFSGVYNAVAPQPATNRKMIIMMAKAIKGKFYIPVHVPSFILKLLFGEMSTEVLKSTTVRCDKIHNKSFTFLFPSIEAAVIHLEGQRSQRG